MNDVVATLTTEDQGLAGAAADGSTLPVSPGTVYELRFEVRDLFGRAGRLRFACVDLDFRDEDGRCIPQAVAGRERVVPDTEPCRIEAFPAGWDDELSTELAFAWRFIVAPPDAITLSARPREEWAKLTRVDVAPVGVIWRTQGARTVGELERLGRLRSTLIRKRCRLSRLRRSHRRALRELRETPVKQFQAIAQQFRRRGEWASVLGKLDPGEAHKAYRARVTEGHGEQPKLGRVGFIGTERSYLRLLAWFDVVLLREGEWRDQLASLTLDAAIVETCPVDFRGEWKLAFGGLDGHLGTEGRAFITTATDVGVPTTLWVTAPPTEAYQYDEMRRSVDRLVVEGRSPAAWMPLSRDESVVRHVPRALEPRLATPIRTAPVAGMLAPIVSDLYHSVDVREKQATVAGPDMLHTDFTYTFKARNLPAALRVPARSVVHCSSYLERVHFLQHAKAVVLYRETLRSEEDLEDIVLDAVAAGALVLLVAPGVAPSRFGELVMVVNDARALDETLRLANVDWWRERAWRTFHRRLMASRRWRRRDASALLSVDCTDISGDDEPLVSAVIVSKRIEYLPRCLDMFRKQTWRHRELLLVLNTAERPDDAPPLYSNERLLYCPEHRSIGSCLNFAIADANGKYWAKMDDDDDYSRFYLEDLVNCYESTRSDVIGRQSCYFYLAGQNTTIARSELIERSRRHLASGEYISGASLSGRRKSKLPFFSFIQRNSADSEWLERVIAAGFRVYSLDTTSLVVFRHADPNMHTWRNPPSYASSGIEDMGTAHFFEILERPHE